MWTTVLLYPPYNYQIMNMVRSGNSTNTKNPSISILRPYNSYNIFFILERVRIIEDRRKKEDGVASLSSSSSPSNDDATRVSSPSSSSDNNSSLDCNNIPPLCGYEHLELPPLPPRYAHLKTVLPSNWANPGKNKSSKSKRKHSRSHGCELVYLSIRESIIVLCSNHRCVFLLTSVYLHLLCLYIFLSGILQRNGRNCSLQLEDGRSGD